MFCVCLSGVMIFLAIFSFSAEKRVNRMIFGVSALCADIILACTTLPMLLSNVPHEGLSIVYNLGISSYLFYLAIAVACSVSVTYNAVKLRRDTGAGWPVRLHSGGKRREAPRRARRGYDGRSSGLTRGAGQMKRHSISP